MLDMKFVREHGEEVKANIRKKFQDHKLPLVDEAIELDKLNRSLKQRGDDLRAQRNSMSKQIGGLMKEGKRDEAEEMKKAVSKIAEEMKQVEEQEAEISVKLEQCMMQIPNMIDPSVPIGKSDEENVELERFGDPVVPEFEIPYHTEIMERFNGIDLDSVYAVILRL